MSDISMTFPWPVLVIFFLAIGWPGFLIGGLLGALAWRAHRVIGGIIGALALDCAWAFLWLDLGTWRA
jgi:hypothetical protein